MLKPIVTTWSDGLCWRLASDEERLIALHAYAFTSDVLEPPKAWE
jgi:hypothetical protein